MLDWFRRGTVSADTGLDPGSFRWRLVSSQAEPRECAAAVLWDLSSQRAAYSGDEALARVGRHPRHFSFVRPIEAGVLADFDAAEVLARRLFGSSRRPHVLAALPARCGEPEMQFFAEMLREAGAASVCLVPATACAALAAVPELTEVAAVAVVELGHELVQATVYSRGAVVAHRQQPGGASELCRRLRDHLLGHHYLDVGRTELEALLPHLYCANAERGSEWFEVAGKDLQSGLPRSLPVAYWELSRWIEATLEPVVALIAGLIEDIPPTMLQQILQDGLRLGGGFSELGGLPEYLQLAVGLPVRRFEQPQRSVARGLEKLLQQPATLDVFLANGPRL